MMFTELPLEQKILLEVYKSGLGVTGGMVYEKLKPYKVTTQDFERCLRKLFDLGYVDYTWEHKDKHSIRFLELPESGLSIAKAVEKALSIRNPVLKDASILDINNQYGYEETQKLMGSMKIEGEWGFKNIFLCTEFWADTAQYCVGMAIPQYCTEVNNVVKEIVAIMPHIKPVDGKRRIIVHYDEMFDAPQLSYDEKTQLYNLESESYCFRKDEEAKLHNLTEIVEYISKYYPEGIDRTSREPFTFTARITYESFKGMNIFELQNEKGENILEELGNRFGDEKVEISVRRI